MSKKIENESILRALIQNVALADERIDKLWGVLEDQHEINQMLTNRLFILESHYDLNPHKSASVH